MSEHDDDPRAHERVRELLAEVREAPEPPPPDDATERILRTARWQRVVRGSLQAVGDLSSALGAGAALVLGDRRLRHPDRGSDGER